MAEAGGRRRTSERKEVSLWELLVRSCELDASSIAIF